MDAVLCSHEKIEIEKSKEPVVCVLSTNSVEKGGIVLLPALEFKQEIMVYYSL